jgi:PleD family two-component response regulator
MHGSMTKVLLLQFDTDPDCAKRREILKQTGASVSEAEPRWPVFFDAVNATHPDVIVIAASLIPSHAIEAARYLGDGFNTRDIPVFLVDVRPNDAALAKCSAPRARIIDVTALGEVIAQSTASG